MGKKTKIGKARKDKFYQLAKETGYRSRAAFKLIQLNRKFEFLQKSRVVVDLCAAPGGWAQVAAENTPVSSVIVAIDLVPIRPIHNVTCLQEDITTDKCRQSLKKELQTWKADCFLNDGAPNVGKNWLHDAFQQAVLTLHAMKLATEFLRKGGWFVTKVFRSKDYNALLWAFQQLFKHVHATKPQASRNESAEIFVVCQGFLAPDKIDPKFLDPKHVFKDVEPDTKAVPLNMVHPEKRRRQTEGYPEGDYTLYHTVSVSDFIHSDQFTELLSTTNAITLDDVRVLNHKLTTEEIKECCKDIKVLGKKELKSLLSWRKKMKEYLDELEGKVPEESKEEAEPGDGEEDEEAEIEKQLAEARDSEKRALKRKLKKIRLEKNKLRHKMDMKMVIPGDIHDFTDDVGLFHLDNLKNEKQLEKMEVEEFSLDEEEEGSEAEMLPRRPITTFDRDNKDYLEADSSGEEEGDLEGVDLDSDSDEADNTEESNPLVVSLEDRQVQRSREMDSWFGKDVFAGLENQEDEDEEIEKMTAEYEKKGGIIIEPEKLTEAKKGTNGNNKLLKKRPEVASDSDSGNESDSFAESESDAVSDSVSESDSDSDSEEILPQATTNTGPAMKRRKLNNANKDGFEVVSENMEGIDPHLDAVGLAIGAAMATSQRRKRDIIDQAYNRYSFEDVNLPDWFAADERKHHRRPHPVTKEEVLQYKQREREINARPIKKIAEAKARKKRKMMKKLERARKKSEAICDSMEVSEREKWSQIKHIYKKAGLLKNKKKELTYVVAKKGMGKRVRRPAGVQGQFKVVDPRMKKDTRKVNAREKRTGKGNKGRGGKKR